MGKVRVGLCARTPQSVLHRRIRKREGCVSRRYQGYMFRISENNKGGSERGSLSQSSLIRSVRWSNVVVVSLWSFAVERCCGAYPYNIHAQAGEQCQCCKHYVGSML
jgi:hypothetical protein